MEVEIVGRINRKHPVYSRNFSICPINRAVSPVKSESTFGLKRNSLITTVRSPSVVKINKCKIKIVKNIFWTFKLFIEPLTHHNIL